MDASAGPAGPTSRRLLLRRWRPADRAAFLDLYGRDEVARWLGPHPRRAVRTEAEATARLRRWHARERDLGWPLGLWAMVARGQWAGTDRPLGTALLLPLADHLGPTGAIEIGWHVHPSFQRRGLAVEAAGALLAAATRAGIGEVLALTDLDNLASQAVARRLGMVDEGITDRWFGLTSRQFRLGLAAADGEGS